MTKQIEFIVEIGPDQLDNYRAMLLVAIEYGYKQHEAGRSLDTAKLAFLTALTCVRSKS